MRRSLALIAFVALVLPGCVDDDFGGDSVHQTVHENIALAANAHVRVGNVSGFIVVVPWNRQAIDVVAHKYGSDVDQLSRTAIEITHDATPAIDVSIETHYQHHGFIFWGNSGASVDYTIHVPKDVTMTLADVSGHIRVSGIAGDVEINNVSGDVEAMRIDGDLSIHTVSGSIDASLLHMSGQRHVGIEAVSGSEHLSIPPNSGAVVSAASISGGFDSDFDIPTHERTVGVQAGGRIGDGSGTIELRTISGSMTLSKK